MHRRAYLAGAWYPGTEHACRTAIEGHAADATPEQGPWRALIGPHAGWAYSGDAAARSFRWLAQARPNSDLVVIFGSHRGPSGPNTVFLDEGWQTPLGTLANARPLASQIRDELDLHEEPAQPRQPDNAVELHLPFVRYFFPKAEFVMVGVESGPGAIEIGKKIGALVKASGRDAVFVGSTDLTHYGPNYGFSPQGAGTDAIDWVRRTNDSGFLDKVLANDLGGLIQHATVNQSACCPGAVAACMAASRVLGGSPTPRLVDHYLSCDIRPSSSFVGYAGVVL